MVASKNIKIFQKSLLLIINVEVTREVTSMFIVKGSGDFGVLKKSFLKREQEFQSPVFPVFGRNITFVEKYSIFHDGKT